MEFVGGGLLHPLHKTIDHLLLAGLLEGDGELVAVDLHHLAVTEFLVEYAVGGRELRNRAGGFCHQFAFDGHRAALARESAARRVASRARGIATRARKRRLALIKTAAGLS